LIEITNAGGVITGTERILQGQTEPRDQPVHTEAWKAGMIRIFLPVARYRREVRIVKSLHQYFGWGVERSL